MWYEKSLQYLIDKFPEAGLSLENSKTLLRYIYEVFPSLDQEGPLTYLAINPDGDDITVEYFNNRCVHAFTLRKNGELRYCQFLRGNENTMYEEVLPKFPDEKFIKRTIKRKMFPREKK